MILLQAATKYLLAYGSVDSKPSSGHLCLVAIGSCGTNIYSRQWNKFRNANNKGKDKRWTMCIKKNKRWQREARNSTVGKQGANRVNTMIFFAGAEKRAFWHFAGPVFGPPEDTTHTEMSVHDSPMYKYQKNVNEEPDNPLCRFPLSLSTGWIATGFI